MLECVTSFNLVENMFGHVFDPPTGQWSYTRSANPNRKPFPTKDGYIGLLPYTDQQWDQFFEIAGWGDTLSKDPRFADFRTRAAHIGELYEMVDEVTRTRTTDEWLALLEAAADPGGADEPLRRPARRPAPGGGRLLRAPRSTRTPAPMSTLAPAGELFRRPPPTSAAIRPGSASTPTRCWPRSRREDTAE